MLVNRYTLSQTVRLNVTIIVFASPDKATIRLNHVGNHIIDQTMLIPDFLFFEFFHVIFLVNSLKSVLKSSVIFFQDCVLGCHVEGVFPLKGKFEATMGKFLDAFICVVHSQSDSTLPTEVVDFHLLF